MDEKDPTAHRVPDPDGRLDSRVRPKQPARAFVRGDRSANAGWVQSDELVQRGRRQSRVLAHPTNQLIWGSLTQRSEVCRVNSQEWYNLYKGPEFWAKALMRSWL